MLYLANCEVHFNYYQAGSEVKELNHIVEADSEEEVKDKINRYYDLKDCEFYVYHIVNVNYINELIK